MRVIYKDDCLGADTDYEGFSAETLDDRISDLYTLTEHPGYALLMGVLANDLQEYLEGLPYVEGLDATRLMQGRCQSVNELLHARSRLLDILLTEKESRDKEDNEEFDRPLDEHGL